MRETGNKFLLISLLLFLIAFLFIIQPVHAEGEQPAEEIVVTETPPTTEDTAEAAEVSVTTTETEAAVADEAVTISRDSGEVILEGDPYYKVGTTPYNFTSIQEAVDSMETNGAPSDHKLYIEAGTYNEYVDIDGSLTGVSGLTGLIGEGDEADDVLINGNLVIQNTKTGFTVSNLSVNNPSHMDEAAIWAENNTGTITLIDVNAQATGEDSSGITILNQKGAVVLNRVQSCNNAYKGVDIFNNDPTRIATTITILNSVFDYNLLDVSGGNPYYESDPVYASISINEGTGTSAITFNGISANENVGDGVYINAPLRPVTIKNGGFSENDPSALVALAGNGIYLLANSAVMENVVADHNDIKGIVAYLNTSFTGVRLYASYNGLKGLEVETCYNYSPETNTCLSTGAGTVTVKASYFITNGEEGLAIGAKGAITLYDISSNGNHLQGIGLINSYTLVPAPVNATLLTLLENSMSGLIISTRGAVTVTNIDEEGNSSDDGVIIVSKGTAPITITINPLYPSIFNTISGNAGNGLSITTLGPVSITSLNSIGNGADGISIDNYDAATPMPVTIKVLNPGVDTCQITGNQNGGLTIVSRGLVTLSNLSVNRNGHYGASIDNRPPTSVPGPAVFISNSEFLENCYRVGENCTWTGIPKQYGLTIYSHGAITLLNVSSNGNYGNGAALYNQEAGVTGGVFVLAGNGIYNSFSDNGYNGLDIYSNGAVVVTNLQVNYNDRNGVEILNDIIGVAAPVTFNAGAGMTNSIIGNKSGDGVYLYSRGVVTITNINTEGNDSAGLYIDNSNGIGAVTIKQVGSWYYGEGQAARGNTFTGNGSYGIYVESRGAVTIAFWQIIKNGSDGISVINSAAAVTINGLASDWSKNVAGNLDNGLNIMAGGNVLLNNISSYANGHDGAFIDNSTTTGTVLGNVTIINGYFDENNFYYDYGENHGLYVFTYGVVLWKNGSANNNLYGGASIQNDTGSLPAKSVTITNVTANRNGETGLYIVSKGAVLLTNVSAEFNSANYYYINMGDEYSDSLSPNQTWTFTVPASGKVTILVTSDYFDPIVSIYDEEGTFLVGASGAGGTTTFSADLSAGSIDHLVISSSLLQGMPYVIEIYDTTIPPGGFSFYDNQACGIKIDNKSGANAPVTLVNSSPASLLHNSFVGLFLESSGVVSVTNINASGNKYGGIVARNQTSTVNAAITLMNFQLNQNQETGALIISSGPITVKNGTAIENRTGYGFGFYMDNKSTVTPKPVNLVNVKANGNSMTGIAIDTLGAVTITGVSANDNDESGIALAAMGPVTFTLVNASGNGQAGAGIMTTGAVTIISAGAYNNFNDNGEYGLLIDTAGKVTLNRVEANNNGWEDGGIRYSGIDISVGAPLGTSAVILTNVFANENTDSGVDIDTTGAITITNIQANRNYSYGILVDQLDAPGSLFPINIQRMEASGNSSQDGLYVKARGNIIISKFVTSSNGNNGVWLDNSYGTGTVTILNPAGGTIANIARFNKYAGLYIISEGTIVINGVEALNNLMAGVIANNPTSSTKAPVTINNVYCSGNWLAGFGINSTGNITINSSWSVANTYFGIYAFSSGNLLIYNTAAIKNGRTGLYIDLSPSGNLTLKSSYWFGNLMSPEPEDANLVFHGTGTITIL